MTQTLDNPATRRRPAKPAIPLVLASASPRRAEILRSAGFDFEARPAGVDEHAGTAGLSPVEAAVAIARAKAAAVAALVPGAAVIGADTLVVLDGQALGKPASRDAAKAILEGLRGRSHTVITAVAVAIGDLTATGVKRTLVRFRDYADAEIAAYVASGALMDKAGAYGIQDRPFSPAESYEGCYLNVVGLPLCLTARLLRDAGALTGPDATAQCPGHLGVYGGETAT
jgi:MAF protein